MEPGRVQSFVRKPEILLPWLKGMWGRHCGNSAWSEARHSCPIPRSYVENAHVWERIST